MRDDPEQLLRAAYAAWNAGDLEAATAHAAPDVEVVQDPELPGAFHGRGPETLRGWLGSFFETWDEFRVELERVVRHGDRVVALARVHARGKASGIDVDVRVGHVATFRQGLIVRFETYGDPEAALRAAGADS